MLRILSFFSFIGASLAQFKPPVLTIAQSPIVPVFTANSIAPVRTIATIGTTIQNITSSISTALSTTISSALSTTISTTISTTLPTPSNSFTSITQTEEPENTEEINTNLFFIIIPATLLLLFLIYLCIRKKKRNINVVNIDLNIENNIPMQEVTQEVAQEPIQETIRQTSNLSNHVYEEIDYESRYEMPCPQNVKYENTIQESANKENEYGKQVATIV